MVTAHGTIGPNVTALSFPVIVFIFACEINARLRVVRALEPPRRSSLRYECQGPAIREWVLVELGHQRLTAISD